MPEPHLRAADTDRAAVATVLGEHMSAGRLTLAEYDERVANAYAAKTFGDLAALTADLPLSERSHAQAPTPQPAVSGPACGPGRAWHRHGHDHSWRAWVRTSLIVLTIWLATSLSSGGPIYFWPIWVIGPWGAVLLAGRITGEREEDRRRRRQLRV
jgi:hypothetical protein